MKSDCCKKKKDCCSRKKCCDNKPQRPKLTEIPGRAIETKQHVETEVKKYVRGKTMKTLIKLIFKLIWKLALLAGSIAGVAYLLNKFAPDVFDGLTDWLKEQRDD